MKKVKVKTSEATPAQINWAVAKCEGVLAPDGVRLSEEYCDSLGHNQDGDFTTDWAQGGPIIEREKITPEWTGSPVGASSTAWRDVALAAAASWPEI